jgi:glycosyltransferase involved in cell wall biosynthesis
VQQLTLRRIQTQSANIAAGFAGAGCRIIVESSTWPAWRDKISITNVIWNGACSAVFSRIGEASRLVTTSSPQPLLVPKSTRQFRTHTQVSGCLKALGMSLKMFRQIERRFRKLTRNYEILERSFIKNRSVAMDPQRHQSTARKSSVLFVGYAEAALGLGEAFRNMLTALDSTDMPFAIYPFSKDVETRLIGPFLESRYDRQGVYDINVAYIAVDQLPYYFSELENQIMSSRYNILQTYWELAEAPLAWRPLLKRIDELWVPNSYVANAFRPIFDQKITVIPVCVNVNRKNIYAREYFGLDDDRLYFIFSFDYYSGTSRKNPLGVAQAFGYAFPDPTTKVGLLIKSTGPGELDPTVSQQLKNLSKIDRRISTLDRSVGRDEMLSLIDNCDCYVSLHRSEGFGLGMAEALALGKAVIATDYSGNRDFLTERTGFPVPFSLRKLMPGEYPMGEEQSWAEPDLEVAIQHMRTVFDNRGERVRRSSRGKQFIEDHYSGQGAAKTITDRLGEIRSNF